MIHRKPVPPYVPSPNSPVSYFDFDTLATQNNSDCASAPPVNTPITLFVSLWNLRAMLFPFQLPDGWEDMIQQAMAAKLDTVHIRRNLTRPPGISPAPSRRVSQNDLFLLADKSLTLGTSLRQV